MIVASRERTASFLERQAQSHGNVQLPGLLSPALVKAVDAGEMRLTVLYKEFTAHDADGKAIGRRREPVLREGEPLKVTVLRVETKDVVEFGIDVAKDCGYKTVEAFRSAWDERHPRSPIATVVWFALGDWRDRDQYLAWSGRRAGADDHGRTFSRSKAMDPDAPVPPEIASAYAYANRQKDDARRAQIAAALATETYSQRLARIDRFIDYLRANVGEGAARYVERDIRQENRIIGQRADRLEKRFARGNS